MNKRCKNITYDNEVSNNASKDVDIDFDVDINGTSEDDIGGSTDQRVDLDQTVVHADLDTGNEGLNDLCCAVLLLDVF